MGWQRPGLTTVAGTWLLVYYASLIPIRYYLKGVAGLYDLLWCCNIAMLLAGFGMLRKSAQAIGTAIAMVAFAHLSWNIDAFTWLVTGVFPIGTSSYLGWPTTTRLEIASTLHHIWFLPLCFYILKGNGDLRFAHVFNAFLISIPVTLLCRFATPLEYEGQYININMAHEVWRDTDIPILHFADEYAKSFYPLYMLYMLVIANLINAICFIPTVAVFRLYAGSAAQKLNSKKVR